MHIREIVVDGFKSYARRTVIAGFDPHFNAITGLNGSGKSNILDSICFVLGISNLSHVRAGSLSELVYKQGQAGVNKAIVTIIFDNSDTSSSPVGYESDLEVTVTRQVLIGGKSKYLINGRNAPAGKVQNLFHSVQLNVNNPHFLIMQGRITKVLNMKPDEILGMVEEAAGTRMYENKRKAALKTIDKKQLKVDELNKILEEEITPTLVRLREEKTQYLAWSKNNLDIERIEKYVIAYDYSKAKNMLSQSEEESKKFELEMVQQEEQLAFYRDEIGDKDEQIETLSDKLNTELEPDLQRLKLDEESISKSLVKLTSKWKNAADVAKTSEEELNVAKSQILESQKHLEEKQKEMDHMCSAEMEEKRTSADKAEQDLVKLQEHYQKMCAGVSSIEEGDGENDAMAMTLPDQISKAHNDANSAEARLKQAEMKIAHLNKSISKLEKEMKQEEASAKKLTQKQKKLVEKVSSIKAQIASLDFSVDEFKDLESQYQSLEDTISNLEDTVQTLSAQLKGRLAFEYSDPVRGFDRSKVKGLVARLISVDKNKTEYATALEVVAGGKLFNVVVDEAITGKALLERGKLKKRVTIIPLDKITPRSIPNGRVNTASSIASKLNAQVYPAVELVGFDEEIRNAVEFVFGSSLVVNDDDAANKICDLTKTRTVTIQGDVYDPSGTISGGSNKNLSTLQKLTELLMATSDLNEQKKMHDAIKSRWDELRAKYESYEKLSGELELVNSELSIVEKHLSQTSYGVVASKHSTMLDEVEEAKQEIVDMESMKKDKWDLYKELQEKEGELTRQREEKLQRFESDLKMAKQKVAEESEKFRQIESISQKLKFEIETLSQDIAQAQEASLNAEQTLKNAVSDELELHIKVEEQQTLLDSAKAELEETEARISDLVSQRKVLLDQKAQIEEKAEQSMLNGKKVSVQMINFQKNRSNAERLVSSYIKKHAWIEEEERYFGVEGGDYDFNNGSHDPDEMSNNLAKLKSEQASLAKKINKKVMGMIEKAEGEYTELLRKRKVVENDKKKIQAVIESLDIKKKSELERTWVKVNRDFGSVFSSLLPGTQAKLEPPEGMQAWEGLEVKVAFGDVWKESLSELSGGQRSLIALSLILSLLLFKPAPMYILDEVDAALDLSHTQNIGNMLKTHFSQSQFIVVSLKEGMFNNANVIFRTKFVDGVSTVTRTIGSGPSTLQDQKSVGNRSSSNRKSFKKRNNTKLSVGGKENLRS